MQETHHIGREVMPLILVLAPLLELGLGINSLLNPHGIPGDDGLVLRQHIRVQPQFGYIKGRSDPNGIGIQACSSTPGNMLAAVYLLILKVGLVGEISFHRQMLVAGLAFEALPMEQYPIDRACLFCVINPLAAADTFFCLRWREQAAQTCGDSLNSSHGAFNSCLKSLHLPWGAPCILI